VKIQNFVAAFQEIVEDDEAVRRVSRRDLAFLEGALVVALDSISAELKRRDQREVRRQ